MNRFIGATKKKAISLIDKINEWHHVQQPHPENEIVNDLIQYPPQVLAHPLPILVF
jgi:hypothetical protein